MRNQVRTARTLAAAIALVTLLGSSTPALAGRASVVDRISGRQDSIVQIVKRVIHRIFGVRSNETITVPRPEPSE